MTVWGYEGWTIEDVRKWARMMSEDGHCIEWVEAFCKEKLGSNPEDGEYRNMLHLSQLVRLSGIKSDRDFKALQQESSR